MKRILLFFLLLCCSVWASGQAFKIDSLNKAIAKEKDDTNKVNTLNYLSRALIFKADYATGDSAACRALALAQKLNYAKGIGLSYKNIGNICISTGDYKRATDVMQKSLRISDSLQDNLGEASALNGLGLISWNLAGFPQALDYYFKSLALFTKANNKNNIATVTNNIGLVYWDQGDNTNAIAYSAKALKEYEALADSAGIARVTGNIGLIYESMGNANATYYAKALDYDFRALSICQKLGDKNGIAINTSNIGVVYVEMGDFTKGIDYDTKALQLYKEIDSKNGIARCTGNLGRLYLQLKQYDKAESLMLEALTLAKNIGARELEGVNYTGLNILYSKTGQWQKAYTAYHSATAIDDSLKNQENSKKIGKLEAKAEYDKQLALRQADEDKKTALAGAESKRQKMLLGFIGAIALTISAIALIIFRALQITRKQKYTIEIQKQVVEEQKTEVEKQKSIVEDKNKDILDSITYAKRLQDAMLPPLSIVEKNLPQSFVLYKPKDIVAGDFYWMEKVGDTIFIAAADCTGHGVPGALVSVVCSNALNRTVKEFKITDPGKILDKTREIVLETFEKSEGNIQDGMDISLAALSQSKEGAVLNWAGAYNSLWYVKDGKMCEIAADKQPIGKTENQKNFTTHTLELDKADVLYLFTDGYADQFGGPKGKKFKYKQLQEKLLAISPLPIAEQKQVLEATFNEWKGNLEQVDDLLIIGIKI